MVFESIMFGFIAVGTIISCTASAVAIAMGVVCKVFNKFVKAH